MTRDQIFQRVSQVLTETFELDGSRIRLETRLFDELDLDSIDAIDMAVKLQGMTGRRVAEAELRGIRTVGDVVDLIEAQLAAGSAAPPRASNG
jgi:acyl carrier protein